MEKNYSLYIFDLDGTLLDSDPLIVECFHILYKKYKPEGYQIDDKKILTFSGPPIKETFANEFPDRDVDALVEEWRQMSYENYLKWTKLFPGVIELFKRLNKHDIPVAIATNKHRYAADLSFKLFGIDKCNVYSVCAEDAKEAKPSPAGILKCLEHFNISDKSQVIYIGDSKYDELAARNAGVDFGFVSWSPRKLPEDAKIDMVIDDFNLVRTDLK